MLGALSAHAQISFVQSNQCSASAATVNCAFNSNNTAGNLIVVGVEEFNYSATPFTITDSAGNTYLNANSFIYEGGATGASNQLQYAKNILIGANTITVSAASAGYINVVITEYSGANTTNPLDFIGPSIIGNSTTAATGAFTVTNGDLIVGWLDFTNGSVTAGAGFTSRGTDTGSMLEDKTASGSSTNVTGTGTTGEWIAMGVAFSTGLGNATQNNPYVDSEGQQVIEF
jgi:hypothetical protein